MVELLEWVATWGVCLWLRRQHLFAAVIYGLMLALHAMRMTVLVNPLALPLLVVSATLFAILALMELNAAAAIRAHQSPRFLAKALLILRVPVTVLYLGDIIFRLHHWQALPQKPSDQPSLGAAVGGMLVVPLALIFLLSLMLVVYYWRAIRAAAHVGHTTTNS